MVIIALTISIIYFNQSEIISFNQNIPELASIAFLIYRLAPSISKIFSQLNTLIVNNPSMNMFVKQLRSNINDKNSHDLSGQKINTIELKNCFFENFYFYLG